MELKEAISAYKKNVLKKSHVVGLGRGFKEVDGKRTDHECIQVLVDKKVPQHELTRRDLVPEIVSGLDTDVIEVGLLQALRVSRTSRVRPAPGGVSIGHYLISAGTFGTVVYDEETGEPLILSNNHVLANTSTVNQKRAQKGDPILQPGSYDGGTVEADVIGYLERWVPIDLAVSEQVCNFGRNLSHLLSALLRLFVPRRQYQFKLVRQGKENTVDCAVARPVENDLIRDKILDLGTIKGTSEVELDQTVQKSGRTTGVTQGRVRTIDATVTVVMDRGEEALFTDQIILDAMSQGGDSGSIVMDDKNNAVGLLFAGSERVTICNPINEVLAALKVRIH